MDAVVEATIDEDGNLHIPVDLGPVVQRSVGLADQPVAQAAGPPADLPPLAEVSQAELALTLAAAEHLTPRRPAQRIQEEAGPAEPEPYFVGLFMGTTPVYGCPGCAIRGRKPEDIMWHLRSFPAHDRR